MTSYTSLGKVVTVDITGTQTRDCDKGYQGVPYGVQKVSAYEMTKPNIHCSGTIQAKLVWTPDQGLTVQNDPPPKCAVVMEYASAHTIFSYGKNGSATTGFAGERDDSALTYSNGFWY